MDMNDKNNNDPIIEKKEIMDFRIKGMKTIIIIQTIIIIVLVILLFTQKRTTTQVYNEKEMKIKFLQEELNMMMTEHDSVKVEYAQLAERLSQKDSLINTQAEEIRKLISTQADYKRIKKKLDYLRNITQGYVRQIDSLYTVNKELKEENIAITNKYQKTQQANIKLQKDKDELAEKVTLASVIKLTNLSALALREASGGRDKNTDKANRVDKIKVCFTLMENSVAPSGIRTAYVRIARPDKKIISEGEEDVYSFEFNGQRLQYTLKKDIDYENKTQTICMVWEQKDKQQSAMKGTYIVSIYLDNNMIGETQFALK